MNGLKKFCIVIVFGILLLSGEVLGTWWFIGQLHSIGARLICDNIPGLVNKQRKLCQNHPDVMISIGEGTRQAVEECQYQFRNHRWNCSTLDRDASVFGRVMLLSSREAAFVYAILSAGAVHGITRACSQGELPDCGCDPDKTGKGRDDMGEFNWGGCSDNIKYGADFARRFVDARERPERDARALMNLHNNRAGRRSVQKFKHLECKCHGVSGSCTLRTCWMAMEDFRKIGDFLRQKYDSAIQEMMNSEGNDLILANENLKKPTRNDLIYLEESPDYCVADESTGSRGTAGRTCNRTSMGTDGCDIMCCGRGYNTMREEQKLKCECKFHWCCYVRCKTCTEVVDVHTCKAPKGRR